MANPGNNETTRARMAADRIRRAAERAAAIDLEDDDFTEEANQQATAKLLDALRAAHPEGGHRHAG